MNFELSTDQKLLVETVRAFVQKESPPARLRSLRSDPLGFSRDLWRKMGELGWLALPFPERFGGLEQSFVEVSLVLEQLGTALVPEPYLGGIVFAGGLLAEAGTDAQREQWLAPLATGESLLAVAHAERGSRFEPSSVATTATATGDGYVLRGEKHFVLWGNAADAFIVSARTAGATHEARGVSLFLVPKAAAGLRVDALATTDGHRAARLTFDGVHVARDAVVGSVDDGVRPLSLAIDRATAGASAEAVGVMREALNLTVAYLGTREQFGVKIGTFQAQQHRAVDMFIETELARSMAMLAALRAESTDDEERVRAVSAAKAHVAASGRFVTAQAIQLHGGIGISDEHDIGLYFKRMHALATLFGDEEHHLARFAARKAFATLET